MKIAVSSTGPSVDAACDERFGRCACFVIAESDGTVLGSVDNPNATQGHGAGIQAARLVADLGVSVVLTGRCGPNASDTLAAAGVSVVVGCTGTVGEALASYSAERGPSG
ncbi:MAG: NifB/NifX family molybdenum-iron cluster-binding protein [Thermoanaerobaculales bacterium]|jgi:predicted Fe-Mo cluster-binding NifX family protein|nr:NifB/NifX family molybdenum-iron cluster-binding protein [Thermoanaerobaculales bacterium]